MNRFVGILKKIYRDMEKHYWSLKIMVRLREWGIVGEMTYYASHYWRNMRLRKDPSFGMQSSKKYYASNKKRIRAMLEFLADEKSKKVWGG